MENTLFFNGFIYCTMFFIAAIETTFTNIMIHLISQTTVVCEAFKYVDRNIDTSQSYADIMLIKKMRMTKCFSELQQIYRLM